MHEVIDKKGGGFYYKVIVHSKNKPLFCPLILKFNTHERIIRSN
jgi:hypothetical protein